MGIEVSHLSLDNLLSSEPLIHQFIEKQYDGSINGTFEIKKCIDLYNSPTLDEHYLNFQK